MSRTIIRALLRKGWAVRLRKARLRGSKIGLVRRVDIWSTGLSSILREMGLELSGQWPTLTAAIESLRRRSLDILIVSRNLADPSLSAQLRSIPDGPSTIMLLEPDDHISVSDLVAFPVEAVLYSNSSVVRTEECLHSVAAGHVWIDTSIAGSDGGSKQRPVDWSRLSDRELEVAQLASRGLSNKRIAKCLGLSDGTVKVHMHHILGKLGLDGRDALKSSGDTVSVDG